MDTSMYMKLGLSLDRVTITGNVILQQTALTELRTRLLKSNWEQVSDYEFSLKRLNENGILENVAGLFSNPYQASSWRLDTSNHLEGNELEQILIPISMMQNAHLTRIDIAFDIINGSKPNMAHRIFRFGSTERTYFGNGAISEFTGRSKKIETIYSGSRKSEIQIRYYDKLVEQKSRHKELSPEINQWERLELQLRGNSTSNWKLQCKKMLSMFKLPVYSDIENPQERAMLVALENHVVEWSELSKMTRDKFRKLLQSDFGLNDDYSQALLFYFDENVDDLSNEIDSFVNTILNTEE